jgi:hypothetical protein
LTTSIAPAVFFLAVAVAASSSCSRDAAKASEGTPAPVASSAGAPAALATAHDVTRQPVAVQTVSGPVLETMDAATYTYVKVKGEAGDVWAATNKFEVQVGDRVTVPLESPMENFRSESLKRDFPLIYFASTITREGDASPSAATQLPPGHPPMSGAAPTVTEKIPPPAGGRSIASVWADRASLGGQRVTVRGKVVKFNGGIMGRNWIHIQDGSGAAADKTNDLTITTADSAKVGDTITVTGTVAVDKDFGAGYSYAVIVEDAKIE